MNLKDQLNSQQLEAVNTLEGPLLVLAGAGSGKTRVVTFRIIELLRRGVSASAILGLTFTNKAAGEMKERVRSLTQNQVLICTFHSLGVRILRESIHYLGYRSDFTIYDETDSEKLVKLCMSELQLPIKLEAKMFQNFISQIKNSLEDYETFGVSDQISYYLTKIYEKYQNKLKEYNALDFDDLLYLPLQIFERHQDVLNYYQKRWDYLLIDEYQDTNEVQYRLIRHLVGEKYNLCAVGDPDQSIYSWRGAQVKNILNFEKDFPGTRVIKLEQNYRSRTNILEAANALIEYNVNRYEKNLWSALGAGEKIQHFVADNDREEADFVAERIKYHYEQHQVPLKDIVIFYRTNAQSRIFEDRFLARRIPYVIIGGISFYQRREIKDILAFLRLVHSGADYISFVRTINLPKRGIGEATIEKIRHAASQENVTILSYCDRLVTEQPLKFTVKLSSAQKEGLKEFVSILQTLRKIHHSCALTELVKAAITESGYMGYLKEEKDTFQERQANLNELVTKAIEWELNHPNGSLADFLEELSLKSSHDESNSSIEKVNLMTLHNGKGLEFRLTFIAGMEEGLLPHLNSKEDVSALEEERRLCYVGMTRAKEYLYLCEARQRLLWGMVRRQDTSRFLLEIPSKYIEKFNYPHTSKIIPFPKKSVVPVEEICEEPFSDEILTQEELYSLAPGTAVFHQQFGEGIIEKIYEGAAGLTYKILFSNDRRERSIVAKYARLRLL